MATEKLSAAMVRALRHLADGGHEDDWVRIQVVYLFAKERCVRYRRQLVIARNTWNVLARWDLVDGWTGRITTKGRAALAAATEGETT